jgi:hypothetical protein
LRWQNINSDAGGGHPSEKGEGDQLSLNKEEGVHH